MHLLLSRQQRLKQLGLVGYWPLGANAAVLTVQAYGQPLPTTLTNVGTVTWNAGPTNNLRNAVNLDGSTQLLSIPDAPSLNPGRLPFTLEAWINPDATSTAGASQLIAGKYRTTGNNRQYGFLRTNAGLFFNITADGSTVVNPNDAAALSAGVWIYAVGTWDGANARLYVNGTLRATSAFTGPVFTGTGAFTIGALGNDTPSLFFDGKVSDVRLTVGRALNLDQIAWRYNVGQGQVISPFP